MLKKSHVLMLGVVTAGLVGFAAPAASAATTGNHGGLVNVSNNQVPVQACGNDLNTNGAGVQVLAEGGSAVVPLLSPDSVNLGTAHNNRGCAMDSNQQNGNGKNDGGLVNVSNNQVPVQVCGNDVNTNGVGTQAPLEALGILVPVLSPDSVSLNDAVNNRGCVSGNNQQNGEHHAEHHAEHGKCPCPGAHSASTGMATSDLGGKPVGSDVGGKPVGSDLGQKPLDGGLITSGLQGSK
jgi:hypothetical protein